MPRAPRERRAAINTTRTSIASTAEGAAPPPRARPVASSPSAAPPPVASSAPPPHSSRSPPSPQPAVVVGADDASESESESERISRAASARARCSVAISVRRSRVRSRCARRRRAAVVARARVAEDEVAPCASAGAAGDGSRRWQGSWVRWFMTSVPRCWCCHSCRGNGVDGEHRQLSVVSAFTRMRFDRARALAPKARTDRPRGLARVSKKGPKESAFSARSPRRVTTLRDNGRDDTPRARWRRRRRPRAPRGGRRRSARTRARRPRPRARAAARRAHKAYVRRSDACGVCESRDRPRGVSDACGNRTWRM